MASNRLIRYFAVDHLPEPLRGTSMLCADLAEQIDLMLPESAEKTAGLRHLLEAKDCFVRAALDDITSQDH